MKTSKPSSRREFLQAGAAAAVFTIVPRHVLGGHGHVAPSDKVNVALVGAGGRGRENTNELLKLDDVQVIALADPAESFSLEKYYYKGTGGRTPVKARIEKHYAAKTPNYQCNVHEDFRHMLDKEKAIDAILCATPDHNHAYVSAYAMRAKKHVYCEKPLTHNIWETRQVARIAQETGVATQMGNQGHSADGMRETCEWLWSGVIGPVREVHAWSRGNRWNPNLTDRPTDEPSVPASLNWDLWLGPRDLRPYHPAYFPVAWRDFWAFGSANLGDFGCHDLDAACWALDLKHPESIEAHATQMNAEMGPHGCIVYYHFGPRGDKPAVKVTWYDGGLAPEMAGGLTARDRGRGVIFVGDKGRLFCGGAGGRPRLLSAGKGGEPKPKPSLSRSPGHHREWIDACKGGKAAGSNFDYATRLTEIVQLGVLALRSGRRIEWDAANMKAKGVADVEKLINEPRRKGWEICFEHAAPASVNYALAGAACSDLGLAWFQCSPRIAVGHHGRYRFNTCRCGPWMRSSAELTSAGCGLPCCSSWAAFLNDSAAWSRRS
jgi:predicted dehydrogenase